MNETEYIISDDLKNQTIENALKIINDSSANINNVKGKELGFRLALTGLAEVNVKRISHLIGAVYTMEKQIFNPSYIQDLDPRRVFELYKLSVEALNNAAQYVKNTSSFVSWDKLELELRALLLDDSEDKANDSDKKAAKELLMLIGKLKNAKSEDNV